MKLKDLNIRRLKESVDTDWRLIYSGTDDEHNYGDKVTELHKWDKDRIFNHLVDGGSQFSLNDGTEVEIEFDDGEWDEVWPQILRQFKNGYLEGKLVINEALKEDLFERQVINKINDVIYDKKLKNVRVSSRETDGRTDKITVDTDKVEDKEAIINYLNANGFKAQSWGTCYLEVVNESLKEGMYQVEFDGLVDTEANNEKEAARKIENGRFNGSDVYSIDVANVEERDVDESLTEGASYRGYIYKEYRGCHVREVPDAYIAIDEHGHTLGSSKTYAGATGIIDDYLDNKKNESLTEETNREYYEYQINWCNKVLKGDVNAVADAKANYGSNYKKFVKDDLKYFEDKLAKLSESLNEDVRDNIDLFDDWHDLDGPFCNVLAKIPFEAAERIHDMKIDTRSGGSYDFRAFDRMEEESDKNEDYIRRMFERYNLPMEWFNDFCWVCAFNGALYDEEKYLDEDIDDDDEILDVDIAKGHKIWDGLFDVADAQTIADDFGKKVRDENGKIFDPRFKESVTKEDMEKELAEDISDMDIAINGRYILEDTEEHKVTTDGWTYDLSNPVDRDHLEDDGTSLAA